MTRPADIRVRSQADSARTRSYAGIGAEIMGRHKFGPQTGPWDPEWKGWWGPNPPFHTPEEALRQAREAAGDLDVRIGGGPSTVRDFLAADLIDLLHVVIVPIVLGRGQRLWDGLEGIEERFRIETVTTPSGVTHLTMARKYGRFSRRSSPVSPAGASCGRRASSTSGTVA